MTEFFQHMDAMLKTFWFIALPVSIIFLVQTIMTFMGTDSMDGVEADFDGDLDGGDTPFQLFSFRNLMNFLLGFSWTGIAFYQVLENKILLIVVSLLFGVGMVALFFLIIKQVKKLAEDNSFNIKNALNKTAQVYLTIPEHKTGKGKIQISVNGAVHELEALTEGETIKTGGMVRVVRIIDGQFLLVEKI